MKTLGGILIGLGLALVVFGLPRLTDTDRYYMEPGVEYETNVGWFSRTIDVYEVALESGQLFTKYFPNRTNAMTKLTFNNTGRKKCMYFETEGGESTINVLIKADEPDPHNLCWIDRGAYRVTITNTGPPQVIRFRPLVLSPYSPARSIGTQSVCNDCSPLPKFKNVGSLSAIRTQGLTYLAGAGGLFALGGLLLAGYSFAHFIGFAYAVAQSLIPTKRSIKLKRAFEKAKTTGETFDVTTTRAYNRPSTSTFRQQQDIADLDDVKTKAKQDTERLRREKAQLFEEEQISKQEKAAIIAADAKKRLERVRKERADLDSAEDAERELRRERSRQRRAEKRGQVKRDVQKQ